MANNELRNTMQQEAVEKLLRNHRLIVQWATGVGKSRVGINAVREVNRLGLRKILLLVVETAHKENWRREFIDALGEEEGMKVWKSMRVECYASLSKIVDPDRDNDRWWDLIIADEAHHLRSYDRTENFVQLRSIYYLALTATLSDSGDAENFLGKLNQAFGRFTSLSFSVQNAITNNILREPKIFIHFLNLDDIEEPQVAVVEWGFKNARRPYVFESPEELYSAWQNRYSSYNYRSASCTVYCNARQAYEIYDYIYTQLKEEFDALAHEIADVMTSSERRPKAEREMEWKKNEMLMYALKRKKIIGELKTGFAGRLIDEIIGDKKFICFCSSIEQGTELNAEAIISSRRTPKENAQIINDFCEGKIRNIFAVGMIKEGANLTGIQAGIIIQLDKKERSFIQMFGRALRSEDPEQHLIIFRDTRDEIFLSQALSNIDRSFITGIDVATGNILSCEELDNILNPKFRDGSEDDSDAYYGYGGGGGGNGLMNGRRLGLH